MAGAPDGRVLAAWWGGPAGGRIGIQTAELGTDGAWSPPVDASGGTFAPRPRTSNVTYLPPGSAAPQGIVLWPLSSAPLPNRVSLLDLGAG